MLGLQLAPTSLLAAEEGGGGGVHFPPIEDIVKWPAAFGEGEWYAFNKIGLISLISLLVPALLFFLAGRKAALVPKGLQNVVESSIDFVEKQVVMPAIGRDGMRYLPMLLSMFFFIWIGSLFEIIPTAHMPSTARMANPMILALTALVIFVGVGLKHNGLGYIKDTLFPPGVPKALYIIVTPIEILSTFLIRPFSLAVRLFANLLAGHILIVTFTVLSAGLWVSEWYVVFLPLPVFGVIFFVAFETMVSLLQAYVFALLAGVYISSSLSADH